MVGCFPSSQIILLKQWCEGEAGSHTRKNTMKEGIRQDLPEERFAVLSGSYSDPKLGQAGST